MNLFPGKKAEQERSAKALAGAEDHRMIKTVDLGQKCRGEYAVDFSNVNGTATHPLKISAEGAGGAAGAPLPLDRKKDITLADLDRLSKLAKKESTPYSVRECTEDELRFHKSVFDGYMGDGRMLVTCHVHHVVRAAGVDCPACRAEWDEVRRVCTQPEPTAPETFVLDQAKAIVYGPREDTYGHASENFDRIAAGWEIIFGVKVSLLQVGLAMDWLKTARLLNVQLQYETKGTPMPYAKVEDGFKDKGGYAEATMRAMFENPDGSRRTEAA
jgi:hypothetical protein